MNPINKHIRMTFIALICAMMSAAVTLARAENTLQIPDVSVDAGSMVTYPVNLINSDRITNIQFDLYLPTGINVAEDDDILMIDINAARSNHNKHTVLSTRQNDGSVHVVCLSMSNASFSGESGTVLDISLMVANDITVGTHSIELKNIVLTSQQGEEFKSEGLTATITVIDGVDLSELGGRIYVLATSISSIVQSNQEISGCISEARNQLVSQKTTAQEMLESWTLSQKDHQTVESILSDAASMEQQLGGIETQLLMSVAQTNSLSESLASLQSRYVSLVDKNEQAKLLSGIAKYMAEEEIRNICTTMIAEVLEIQNQTSQLFVTVNNIRNELDEIMETTAENQAVLESIKPVEPSTDNTLTLCESYALVGSKYVLPVMMNNENDITALQFDLYLPEGVTVAEADGEMMIDLDENRTSYKKHNISYAKQEDGCVRIVCASMSNATFSGKEGAVVYITLNIPDDIGLYNVFIDNIELTTPNAERFVPAKAETEITAYKLGDANFDNKIDVSDITTISSYILGNKPEGFVKIAADVNADGKIDVADITSTAAIILGH